MGGPPGASVLTILNIRPIDISARTAIMATMTVTRRQERTMALTDREIVEQAEEISGVTGARVWRRYGKARLYLDTVKLNGGRHWNQGQGFGVSYLDLETGQLCLGQVAGAATRNWHEEHGTVEALEALAARIVGQEQAEEVA